MAHLPLTSKTQHIKDFITAMQNEARHFHLNDLQQMYVEWGANFDKQQDLSTTFDFTVIDQDGTFAKAITPINQSQFSITEQDLNPDDDELMGDFLQAVLTTKQ